MHEHNNTSDEISVIASKFLKTLIFSLDLKYA